MNVAEFFDGVVHEPTQAGGEGFDLTVDRVLAVTSPGRIDFGGGELAPAGTDPVETAKRNPDDEYGWWDLDAGQYLLEYNETVASDGLRFTLQPRIELCERCASHPTVTVSHLPRTPLSVAGRGLSIKENARVSTVVDVAPA